MNAAADRPMTFNDPQYRDHFALTSTTAFDGIEDFVEDLAMNQPSWLTRVSMGISGRSTLQRAVIDALDGGSLGNWRTIERTPTSITFAEDMRIMRYRLTFELESSTQVSARTVVVQQSRFVGPTYWLLAVPLHKRFLQKLMRRAGGGGSTTRAVSLV